MTNNTAKSILIVDDDPSFRELLSGFLDGLGYSVQTSVDGAEALDRLRADAADLVLLDLELPGMSGLDVLRYVKSEKIDTKVVAISGHAAARDYLGPDGIKLGAEAFMTKPIDLDQLEREIAAEFSPTPRAKTGILVADDDPVVRELLKCFLEEKGYDVLLAEDGEAALQSVRQDKPDLLLLDLYMPKLNGIEVLERLKEEGIQIAVITISGTDDEAMARSTFELGAADFITKPLDLEYLELSLLAKLIGLGNASDQPG